MSAKPYTAGHDGLIRIASKECDVVHVYVSLSDRKKPNEFPIYGSDMEKIWKIYIENSLPSNVEVIYGGSPIRKIYEEMGFASENNSQDTYVIYSDPTDLSQNFPIKSIDKYAKNLYDNNLIILRPVDRSETLEISGTKMRSYLKTGNQSEFISGLPKGLDGPEVWSILKKNETLLRDYITSVING